MKAIVLVARGMHIGHVGCYGNDWIHTPNLDRFAAEGIVFDQHYVDCPEPGAAEWSWRSGCYSLPGFAAALRDLPAERDLPRMLPDRQIPSLLVTDDQDLGTGWRHGWSEVSQYPAKTEGGAVGIELALDLIRAALKRLKSHKEWLLWIDISPLQPPWCPPVEYARLYPDAADEADESDDEESDGPKEPLEPIADPFVESALDEDQTVVQLQRRYAGAMSYLDAAVGNLLEMLTRQKCEDALLLVTTDRGQALAEHREEGTQFPSLHEEIIHIPLIVRLPGQEEASRRLSAVTQTVDLMPTIVDAFGHPCAAVHGRSLLPLCRGELQAIRPYGCARTHSNESGRALRAPKWAYIGPTGGSSPPAFLPQLYVKPDDRWEVNNVIHHYAHLAENMEKALDAFGEAARGPASLDYEQLPHLLTREP